MGNNLFRFGRKLERNMMLRGYGVNDFPHLSARDPAWRDFVPERFLRMIEMKGIAGKAVSRLTLHGGGCYAQTSLVLQKVAL